jgi:hypothetical protein
MSPQMTVIATRRSVMPQHFSHPGGCGKVDA